MSSVARLTKSYRQVPAPRLTLLGTGVVGSAFIGRYQRLIQSGIPLPGFAWLANSRSAQSYEEHPATALEKARAAAVLPEDGNAPMGTATDTLLRGDVIVDATASEHVADCHPRWLARGVHVVTANKLGAGACLARSQQIARAASASGARYGDSATVGAGLPLLSSLRQLVAGGDRIHRVEGVLSGSLAWLFNHYDGMRPFSGFVREARRLGYTEPDPRLDLSGEDVRRKLLILARAAGHPLQAHAVEVESLIAPRLAQVRAEQVDDALPSLDAPLAARFKAAHRTGARLRFVGRFDAHGARVGLHELSADHALCGGRGTDNCVAIFSDRYSDQPLLIQGPGAGAEVTAAALLDDVIQAVRIQL